MEREGEKRDRGRKSRDEMEGEREGGKETVRGELGERMEPRERGRETEVLLSAVSSLVIGQIQRSCALNVNDSVGWLRPQMSMDLVVSSQAGLASV